MMQFQPFPVVPKILLGIVLLLSAMITVSSGLYQSPRSAPDERHHYAYIKYVAEHFGEFPIEYENIFTDREGDYNHLGHPPLYYYMMASVYRIFSPNKDYTSIVREIDAYGKHSSYYTISFLRPFSWLFVFVGLLGMWKLAIFLSKYFDLPPTMAVLATALVSFVPGFTYIGGALNNDVLVMAVWPYIVLFTLQFHVNGNYRFFWLAVAALAIGVLSKATLWLLVLFFATFLSIRVVYVFFVTKPVEAFQSQIGGSEDNQNRIASVLSTTLALLLCFVALVHLGSNYVRYQSLQPSYDRIYGFAVEDSKFFKAEGREDEIARATFSEVTKPNTIRGMKSLAGVVGHTERFYPQHPEKLIFLFLISSVLILFVSLPYWWKSSWNQRIVVILFLLLPIIMYFFFFHRGFSTYKVTGYFGSQGRYAIAYLQLFIFGLTFVAGAGCWQHTFIELVRRVVCVLAFLAIAFVLVRPLYYSERTLEMYHRAGIPTLVRQKLENEGFEKLNIVYYIPRKLASRSYIDRSRNGLADYHVLNMDHATLVTLIPIRLIGKDIEVVLWARGNSIPLAEGAVIQIALSGPVGEAAQDADSENIELHDAIDVYKLRLNATAELETLSVSLMNYHFEKLNFLAPYWALKRTPLILGVYVRQVPGKS